ARAPFLWLQQRALDPLARGGGDRAHHRGPVPSQQCLAHSSRTGMATAPAAQIRSQGKILHPPRVGGSDEETGQEILISGAEISLWAENCFSALSLRFRLAAGSHL